MKRILSLIMMCTLAQFLHSQTLSPPYLPTSAAAALDLSTVTTIEAGFNSSRRNEENIYGICPNSISDLDLPDQAIWDAYSVDQKALYIINDERRARGGVLYPYTHGSSGLNGPAGAVRGYPFNGVQTLVDEAAQFWTDHLTSIDSFKHCSNTVPLNLQCPDGRVNTYAGNGCAGVALENLWGGGQGWTITNAAIAAIHTWTYGTTGHRNGVLSQGYGDDYGNIREEGLVGYGITNDGVNQTIVAYKFSDPPANPAGSCNYTWSAETSALPGCTKYLELSSQNAGTAETAGGTINVTWNVPNCFNIPNINILLSLDGGMTYPISLANSTSVTDGTETVTLPAGIPNNTTTARIRIESTGSSCHYFSDDSDINFTINSNCLLSSTIICPADSVSFPAGNGGLNLTITPDYFAGITQWNASSTTESPLSRMVNSLPGGAGCNLLSNWAMRRYVVLDFKVSQAGNYTFVIPGFNQMVVYTGTGYDPNNPCQNYYRAVSEGNSLGGNGTMSNVALTPCATYQLVVWLFSNSPPQTATVTFSGPGMVYETSNPPPTDYDFTAVAVNRTTNMVVAHSSTSDFTTLPTGDYMIYGASYFNGSGNNPPASVPNSWLNQTMAQIIGAGSCVRFSQNGKALNVTPGTGGVLLSAKAFFQGPYSSTLMNDGLRSNNLIPSAEPYTALNGFTHVNGGGESVAASVLATTGNDAIVDWVFLELRDKTAVGTVQHTRSALIQRDGDIVDTDGSSPVSFPNANPDDYYIAIRHRNHLGIRTNTAVSLSGTATALDLTTASANIFSAIARVDLGGNIWGMWGGNATGNANVRATGPPAVNDYSNVLSFLGTPTAFVNSVYAIQDFNMDGTVRVTGPPTVNDYSKLLSILGTPTTIIYQQL